MVAEKDFGITIYDFGFAVEEKNFRFVFLELLF